MCAAVVSAWPSPLFDELGSRMLNSTFSTTRREQVLPRFRTRLGLLSVIIALALTACGGSDGPAAAANVPSNTPSSAPSDANEAATVLSWQPGEAAPTDVMETTIAQPTFHAAPVLLDEPDDTDAVNPNASALSGPRMQMVPAELRSLSTRGLTADALESARRSRALSASGSMVEPAPVSLLNAEAVNRALASGTAVATYTPAQIRAAYGLPALPASGSALTGAQKAQLGAGQTIYIVAAKHNPNVAAELAAFNTRFGLPSCTTKALPVQTALPLAVASTEGCEFSVVYSTNGGGMTATTPGYDSGWATEIALDVQWAHATAPLARIVLIEAADASLNSLLGSIRLANAMGPGIVSMSFGAPEGNYTAAADSAFSAPNMSYLAATGDWGAGVYWPSVSPKVVAVGGTTLSYSGTGARSEVAWSGTGGGTSAFTAKPAYQTAGVTGLSAFARRAVADVAFNANPSSGQFVAVMSPGSSAVKWLSIGGTSLSTPQWAGLLAVANAMRAQTAKAALGSPHAVLYSQIGAVPGTYAAAFADVQAGSHGSCASCTAKSGYDQLTGLGTPNVTGLLNVLSGAATTSTATGSGSTGATPAATPSVAAAAVTAKPGTPLSFAVLVSSANPVTYSLSDAPVGMVISGNGVLTWPNPLTGTYAVTVNATDGKTQQIGRGLITVQVAGSGPVVTVTPIVGVVSKAITGSVGIAAPGATSLSISVVGAPAGMQFAMNGMNLQASWAKPVVGIYSFKVTVTDSFGKTASASVPVTVTAQ